jgi:hypothetical protein
MRLRVVETTIDGFPEANERFLSATQSAQHFAAKCKQVGLATIERKRADDDIVCFLNAR